MLSVEEALAGILAQSNRLPSEVVPLMEAQGRVLAEAITAECDLPPFDNSAVDGYAVLSTDTECATSDAPVTLRVIGEVVAGELAEQHLITGTAIRVMTGAPMPLGADAMVMVEDTRLSGDNTVQILLPARKHDHIRFRGEEIRQRDTVLTEGTPIYSTQIGLLARAGHGQVRAYRRPRVAVISTGDELIGIEEPTPPLGKIRDSNRYALGSMVQEAGAILHSLTHIPDDLAATEAAFRQCVDSGADVIVTAGGVSVGDRDYVKPVLEKLGRLEFWRIAMKPGKPLAFGQIGNTLFFGLPGNPVSAMVTFELFARPALRKMAGYLHSALMRPTISVTLSEPILHTPPRREYARAIVTLEQSGFVATTTGNQGSSRLSSMAGANALIVIPEYSNGLDAGEQAQALLLNLN